MAKDHFVAQTYLRHFGDPSRKGMLHAYRKSDGKYFPCNTKDVCHEWDGDLNPLLVQSDILGQFRKLFEPRWHTSILTLLSRTMTPEDKFAVSGYFANLMVCTPTWRRIGAKMYDEQARAFLIFRKEMQEKHGSDHDVPIEAIEMLERGELTLQHNPNFIKAKVTQDLMKYTWETYHQNWTIIDNATGQPFITSDNPVAVHQSANLAEPMMRFLPITPKLCLSVRYDREDRIPPPAVPSLPLPRGVIQWGKIAERDAKLINKRVAQCAEDLVFSSVQSAGIESLVRNCAQFRVDADFIHLPAGEPDARIGGGVICVRDMGKAAAASRA